MAGSQYTGRKRDKQTPWTVKAGDVAARLLITVGGIGTVIAVSTVFVFLVWVVVPLFRAAKTDAVPLAENVPNTQRPLHVAADEYQLLAWTLNAGGTVTVHRLDTGAILHVLTPFTNATLTAVAFAQDGARAAFGFADGSVRFGRVGFVTDYRDAQQAPPELQALTSGAIARDGNALVQRTSPTQLRSQRLTITLEDALPGEGFGAVRLLDQVESATDRMLAVLYADGTLRQSNLRQKKNMITGKITLTRSSVDIPYAPPASGIAPTFLALSGLGDALLLAWPDGTAVRFNTRASPQPSVIETLDLVADADATLTACRWLLGRTTLLAGDSTGTVRAWFSAHPEEPDPDAPAINGPRFVCAHTYAGEGAAVTSLAPSSLMRLVAIGYADGTARLLHATSHKRLADLPASGHGPVAALALTPKDNGIITVTAGGLARWTLAPGHPEVTANALFRPVWYEGAARAEHVWQSSSGTDDFEPKLGLMPLIFGTLKATLFSLLFGVPIALLAAIFTSEFLSGRTKATIKPVVEMMASLPSVVLGFLAALVFAPIVADALPMVLAMFLAVPLMFLLGAYAWQLMPHRFTLRYHAWRFPLMFATLPIAYFTARAAGPLLERVCFAGDAMRWLDGQIGSATGGWALCLVPVTALAVSWLSSLFLNPKIRRGTAAWSRGQCALLDLGLFAAKLLVSLLLTTALSFLLTALGLDPRGGIFDTYIQRNALVVGFVMGFAVIPIIYTIAEDALTAVPEHLRSASLAAGATPWQTAIWIIVPTAMSGLFSAVMIGLGRAVGETMIVLMAAGNTPLMEWNLFNGFRTLSANIAVELPEAVRNSTHYRTLFLAALSLFVMTFILNTIAETIRQRFRKKAFQL